MARAREAAQDAAAVAAGAKLACTAAAEVWDRARARVKAAREAAAGLGSAQVTASAPMELEATSPGREKRKGEAASDGRARARRLRA